MVRYSIRTSSIIHDGGNKTMTHNQHKQIIGRFLRLALVFGMAFVSLHSVFAADRIIENGTFTITMKVMKGETDKEDDEFYSIEVTDRATQTSRTLEAAPLVKHVSDVCVVANSQFLIRTFWKLNYLTEDDSLYDLNTGKRLSSWRGYGSSLSQSSRYLAYLSNYPPMILSQYRRQILLICDFDKDLSDYTPGLNDALPHSEYMFGALAFPERNAFERSYDVMLDDEYLIESKLLWSKDEKTLVFFAANVPEREFYIVRIDITAGIDHPQIAKKRIDVATLSTIVNYLLAKLRISKKGCQPFIL